MSEVPATLAAFGRFSTGTRHRFRANGRNFPYFEVVEAAGGHAYTKEFNTEQGGPSRRVMGLLAANEGETIQKGEWALPVYQGQKIAGTSRRQGFSYGCRRGIAAGLPDMASVRTGDQVVIRHPGGQTVCTVAEFPVLPPRSR